LFSGSKGEKKREKVGPHDISYYALKRKKGAPRKRGDGVFLADGIPRKGGQNWSRGEKGEERGKVSHPKIEKLGGEGKKKGGREKIPIDDL